MIQLSHDSGRLNYAVSLLDSGLSILPIRTMYPNETKGKKPDGKALIAAGYWEMETDTNKETGEVTERKAGKWKTLQTEPISAEMAKKWYGNGTPRGIAIIGGAVSGNLEILDFDEVGIYEEWLIACERKGVKSSLISQLPLVETPSGGRHLYYRLSGPVDPNTTLASNKIGDTRIETRGEGGYVLAPHSPIECHKDRKPYLELVGTLTHIPVISKKDRDIFFEVARSFDILEVYSHGKAVKARDIIKASNSSKLRPGDDFNNRVDFTPYMERYGCTFSHQSGPENYFVRPGKDSHDGYGVTTGYRGLPVVHIFTSSWQPYPQRSTYTYFDFYAQQEHGGDYKAAAKALAEEGYGTPAEEFKANKSAEYAVVKEAVEPWGEPIPFNNSVARQQFPIEAIPATLGAFVKEVSASTEVPLDLCAMLSVSVACAAVRGRAYVQVGMTHAEALSIYLLGIMPSASRKSEALRRMAAPMFDAQYRLRLDAADANKSAAGRLAADQSEIEFLRKQLNSKSANRSSITAQIEDMTARLEKPRSLPQLIMDDTTPEAMAEEMEKQEDCAMAVMSSEGIFFDNIAGRYNNKQPNLDLVLKGYDGDAMTVNRKNGNGKSASTLFLHRPAVNMALLVQPGVVEDAAANKAFRERGFLARLMYCYPDAVNSGTYTNRPIDGVVSRAYASLIDQLIDIPLPCTPDNPRARFQLRLEGEGLTTWAQAYAEFEQRRRDGDMAGYDDFGGKHAGKCARMAGLFHLIDCVQEIMDATETPIESAMDIATRRPISVNNVLAGWAVANYLVPQALYTFGSIKIKPETRLAEKVLKWIVKTKPVTFTARDYVRTVKGVNTDEALCAINELVEHGFVRKKGSGASVSFLTHPQLL